jgi:D-aminoacyl-tRNA deacylase
MRILIQRVSRASVTVKESVVGAIDSGLLLFIGVEEADEREDIDWLVQKIGNMRIFSDSEGKMNLSLLDIKGSLLCISQFTLHANTKKGNRPSFIRAAKPAIALQRYREIMDAFRMQGIEVAEGQFGEHMEVSLVNDGPVTIWLDSKNRE